MSDTQGGNEIEVVTPEVLPELSDHDRIERLEEEVAVLKAERAVAGAEVIYRPPLWSQLGRYSARDDRTLLEATFLNGVVSPNDLRVRPRAEGPNLSVDVLPGLVSVWGTDQAAQGRYLCTLAQKVNIAIAQGPATGQARWDKIVAHVDENNPNVEAEWHVERVAGTAATMPHATIPPNPPSTYTLAVIGPIQTNTAAITDAFIWDTRRISRPAPLGGIITMAQRYPDQWVGHGLHHMEPYVNLPVFDWPTDLSATFTAVLRSDNVNSTLLRTGLQGARFGGDPNFMLDYSLDYSINLFDFRSVTRQMFYSVEGGQGPAVIMPVVGRESGSWGRWHNPLLIVRMTPRGSVAAGSVWNGNAQ